MADEKPAEEISAEAQPDDSEEKFWEKFDQRSEAAFDRYLAKVSGEIDEEEAEKERVSFEARKKAGKKPEPKEDDSGSTEGVSEEPTEAERRRAAGGVGPGQPSGYWERVGHRLLYGNRRRL